VRVARWVLVALWMGACGGSSDKAAPAPSSTALPAAAPAQVAAKTDAAPAPVAAALAKPVEAEPLQTEEPEANPFSETVTLKLSVTPQVKAQINWGAKTLARVEPGKMDAEITRPRGSGPLDVEVKAEGFLPYHTRLYADRNDKLGVRLYRPEEAPGIFGYSRSPEAKKAATEPPR
jgi:hypothetical protein